MNQQQKTAEQMRVREILHRAKQDIEKIFIRVEQELCADLSQPMPVLQRVQQRFGRLLNPTEIETVAFWMGKYHQELIECAINEAFNSNKLNIRYIDRILLNWEKAGIKDAKAAIEYTMQFKQRTTYQQPTVAQAPQEERAVRAVPFYNWLEERE